MNELKHYMFRVTCIRQVVNDIISDLAANNEPIPAPLFSQTYSGKFIVRVPPELHRRLALEAAEAGISLNRIANLKLSN